MIDLFYYLACKLYAAAGAVFGTTSLLVIAMIGMYIAMIGILQEISDILHITIFSIFL